MGIYVPTSGSVYGSDASIPGSVKRYTELFLVADAGAAASANIQHGLIAASTIALLRAPDSGMSPGISFLPSGCLSIDGLEDGDVVALIKE